jgi:hypothetical protein
MKALDGTQVPRIPGSSPDFLRESFGLSLMEKGQRQRRISSAS